VRIEPRPDWRAIVSAQGLVYCETLHPDGEIRPYWDDGTYYSFAPEEISELERVSAELFSMCIDAGDRIQHSCTPNDDVIGGAGRRDEHHATRSVATARMAAGAVVSRS